MAFVSFRNWRPTALAISALSILLLASSGARAQPADHGVQPWQAERAINDFVQVFVANQVLTNDYSHVRVKISQVTPVYSKDFGWIYVAIFEGAIVPDVADPNQTQTAFHGILKVSAENDMEVIVNEGQGLMEFTTSTELLQQELPAEPGDWASWGGPAANPDNQQATAPPPPPPTVPPPPPPATGSDSGPGQTSTQQKIEDDYHTANDAFQAARNADPRPANLPELEARYREAYAKYIDMRTNPDKYK